MAAVVAAIKKDWCLTVRELATMLDLTYITIQSTQLLLVRREERPERPPLSATVWRGTPPPPLARGGWRHPVFSSEYGRFLLWCYCYTGQMIYHLEGSLASSAHTGGLRYVDVFPLPPARHIGPGGMDLGRGGDVVPVRLRPQYVATQRETSASPWRSGYGDTSSPRSFRARAGSYGNSPGSGSQTSLFHFLYVNVDVFKAWF